MLHGYGYQVNHLRIRNAYKEKHTILKKMSSKDTDPIGEEGEFETIPPIIKYSEIESI